MFLHVSDLHLVYLLLNQTSNINMSWSPNDVRIILGRCSLLLVLSVTDADRKGQD